MSGFAVVRNRLERKQAEAMLGKIAHRGPYVSGLFADDSLVMAQNYLRADHAVEDCNFPVPVRSTNKPYVICYDGQMGNWQQLAQENDVEDGPFREERLLLVLFDRYGKDMLRFLSDAIFTLAIWDGKELFVARDMLGIKTLFYGWNDGVLYLASELKAVLEVTPDMYEFPCGHYMDGTGEFTPFASLPEKPPKETGAAVDEMAAGVRAIIERSFRNRIDFSVPIGGLLSGGMDSSVINLVGSRVLREKFGEKARLKTFAIGVGESNDILSARLVAQHIGSEHHELLITLEQALEVLPDVIYYLESFDPSLVRSSISNFLVTRYAREHGIEELLSGEGGDEIFCGYKYLEDCPADEMFSRQMECMGFLHNNASLRLDRMNHCHFVRVVAPLISGELLNYSLTIPPGYKMHRNGERKIEKWIFRKAYEKLLPDTIVWRSKQEFSQGSGSAGVLPQYFENEIADSELEEAKVKYPVIRSKEELHYFKLFTGYFGDSHAVNTVGQWLLL
jgi:asparagine synthase (glutamine-hydrolysing)